MNSTAQTELKAKWDGMNATQRQRAFHIKNSLTTYKAWDELTEREQAAVEVFARFSVTRHG